MVWQQHSCHSMGVTLCPAASVLCQQSRGGSARLSTTQPSPLVLHGSKANS